MTMLRLSLISLILIITEALSAPTPVADDTIDILSDGLHGVNYALRQLSLPVPELDAPVSAVVHLVENNFTTNTDHSAFRLLIASVCQLVSYDKHIARLDYIIILDKRENW